MLKRTLLSAAALAALAVPAEAREAAFQAPPVAAKDAAAAGPKGPVAFAPDEADQKVGEILVGRGRRLVVTFLNGTGKPVRAERPQVGADGGTAAEIVAEDCSAPDGVRPGDRCAVTVLVTASGAGPWNATVSLVHDGPGRIAKAVLSGASAFPHVAAVAEGLVVEGVGASGVDFGAGLRPGVDTAARSVVVRNATTRALTIRGLEIVAPPQGLSKRPGGCEDGTTLQPGGSCAVTMVWQPQAYGAVSTELLVGNSAGTAPLVVALRGGTDSAGAQQAAPMAALPTGGLPPPPPLPGYSMPGGAPLTGGGAAPKISAENLDVGVDLIGVVGSTGIFRAGGKSRTLGAGGVLDAGGKAVKVLSVEPTRATVTVDGKRRELRLAR